MDVCKAFYESDGQPVSEILWTDQWFSLINLISHAVTHCKWTPKSYQESSITVVFIIRARCRPVWIKPGPSGCLIQVYQRLIQSTKVSWGINWDITVSYLLQFPVELSRSEGVHLGEVSPQQEHQAAIMDIQRVVMTVHLCGREGERGVGTRDQIITPSHCLLPHLVSPSHLCGGVANVLSCSELQLEMTDFLSPTEFLWCGHLALSWPPDTLYQNHKSEAWLGSADPHLIYGV